MGRDELLHRVVAYGVIDLIHGQIEASVADGAR